VKIKNRKKAKNKIPLFKELCQLSMHEAGHYVVASELGFKVQGIKIAVNNSTGKINGTSRINLDYPIHTLDDTLKFLESRVMILLAGAISESIKSDRIDEDNAAKVLQNGSAVDDFAKVQEYINLIRNIKHPTIDSYDQGRSFLDTISDELWNESLSIIIENCDKITCIGDHLASKVKKENGKCIMGADEINDILLSKEL